jgi:acyl-coenzyme A thioesterase PaaI-like protein
VEAFQVDFGLDTLPVRLDCTVDYTRPGADCELVTLVAIIIRVLHKVTVKRSLTVPRADIGQTHSGSLEGKSTITAWKLTPG